ncbi:glycoside hydrolase family 78 protein [Flavobacterium flavipallidum]|uniref:Fibronectin type-III domain-containing protein n=1 Tax=Flavobacterium flavipallidum TaxID=3139140 RepID=A0ABU9HLG3_9FLAO
MKKFIFYNIIGILSISCSGGDETNQTAPIAPTLVAPANNELCLDNAVDFEWDFATETNSTTSYQIQIAKDNQFAQIVKTVTTVSDLQTIQLEKNTAYYWRIKATDSQNSLSSFSTTYKFYTAGEAVTNHLPFLPELVFPASNSVLNTATTKLSWTATDVDATDVLVYDVYFGITTTPTQKVAENLTTTTFDVNLNSAKEYYWKVVVKDNKGGETTGQIWKFKTN